MGFKYKNKRLTFTKNIRKIAGKTDYDVIHRKVMDGMVKKFPMKKIGKI